MILTAYKESGRHDAYFERVSSYLMENQLASPSQDFLDHTVGKVGVATYKTLDDVRDQLMGIENSLHFRLDNYFQQGFLDRMLQSDGNYAYWVCKTDKSDLTHLSDESQIAIRKGRQWERAFNQQNSQPWYDPERSQMIERLLQSQYAENVEKTLRALTWYVDASQSDLYQKMLLVLMGDQSINARPIDRAWGQWAAMHVAASAPELHAVLSETWKQMGWDGEPLKSSFEARLPSVIEFMTNAGWSLARQDNDLISFTREVYGIHSGVGQGNSSLFLYPVGAGVAVDPDATCGPILLFNGSKSIGPGVDMLAALSEFIPRMHKQLEESFKLSPGEYAITAEAPHQYDKAPRR